jgi:crotonobetainyl-CoA:carnitine CoA-transferase CaiB-like acyl-CoA transferase
VHALPRRYGADVLRIDPPRFQEVGALLAETTVGKRRSELDLTRKQDRTTFETLLAGAHVLVHGYRSDALGRLGYAPDQLTAIHPDSLVQ